MATNVAAAHDRSDRDVVISVILVCLNAEQWLEEALQSLFSQTHRSVELIVIDGGSTDRTLPILTQYRQQIATLVSEPDQGIYDAMNKGLFLAGGELIYFLNSDDALYDDGVLAALAAASVAYPDVDVFYGDALLVYEGGREVLSRYPNILLWEFFRGRTLCHQATIARRSAFERVGGYDPGYRLAGDFAWILKSRWEHDLHYRYLPLTICRFRMGGSHGTPSSTTLLRSERERAVASHVRGRYRFLSSHDDRRVSLRGLLVGDPAYAVRSNGRGIAGLLASLANNIRQTNRLRWHLLKVWGYRMLRGSSGPVHSTDPGCRQEGR
ncbi:glycosyltransferase [Geomonas sp. Red32]|nr:glycosyltransferase [Geomonas sp. Red32]